jgi:2-C-methyl-D-erythritol 2,4-cyclodiphosphate synthase
MNLKVTTPDDLGRAELTLLGRSMPRVGYGEDGHTFGPGGPLALGGITIEGAPRLHGHSDGDVVLHAVADALLGAAGLGDLGRVFPAGPATPKGIASGELLTDVVRRLAIGGLRPAQLDVTVVAARPRLGGGLEAMRAAIAGLTELPIERVNVKASTGNLAGMEGAGRGIAARAVAVVEAIR